MGTRNLTAVMIDGEYKIAQYGQWDGYPSGQGATALAFLQRANLEKFAEKVRATKWVTEEQLRDAYEAVGVARDAQTMSMDHAAEFKKQNPQFDRDMGAEILRFVADAKPGVMLKNSISFAADSLFCEYAYVIDLDKQTFEAYRGFNKEPLAEDERFYGAKADDADEKYTPIRCVRKWALNDLPSKETFLKDLEENDEEN